ncbi:MAG: penicillin-binding protein 2 [Lentisphaerae bacterium]|nr:penicillin-binding protein 2 [Lentisphaerota bacterium]
MSAHLNERDLARLRLIGLGMLLGLGLLALLLWRIQVGRGERYEISLEQQSIRRVQIPGPRGLIFDRQGRCLADNRPDYCIALYLEELRQPGQLRITTAEAWQLVERVAAVIELAPSVTYAQVEHHLYNRKALPLIAWRHVPAAACARLAEASLWLPLAEILVEAERFYPQAASASHLLGYVGAAAKDTEADGLHSYWPEMVGRSGLEKRYDDLLRGEPGGRLVRVDVSGFKHDQIAFREPVAGGDLVLAIDQDVQRQAEAILVDKPGAVVVLDPRNGDVLALASSPAFDPNEFSPAIQSATWARTLADPHKPLLNRALSGLYAPGSVFKPLVALAALESGQVTPEIAYTCQGYHALGAQRFACFGGEAHGRLNLRQALQISCNTFFYKLGLQCGIDPIYHLALAVGLGQKTGIDLDYEAAGVVPGKGWKRIRRGEAWRDGDTCNIAIGQGDLLVTPLQMAVATAAIANGGRLYQPRLILRQRPVHASAYQDIAPVLVRELPWKPAHLALVKAGMRDVIQSPSGTGHLARVPETEMAGKTGTAEYGRKGSGRSRGWMVLFAPYQEPRYAVAMVLDEALSGGATVGPLMRQLMSALLNLPREDSQ